MTKRHYLFGTTVLAGLLVASAPAWAQTSPAQQPTPAQRSSSTQAEAEDEAEAQTLDEVVVTGSRIRRPQYEGTVPGAQVDRAQIEERGFTNAISILNDIPLVGPPVSSISTGTVQPANFGAQYVDLLDIGSARTLTLVNGRRMVSNNGGTIFVAGNEPGNQVDASTIPASLIDRVDVLTVGGAAAYGSDAVAGVVNYILRDDFDGLETRASVRGYEDGQGETYQFGLTAGRNFLNNRLNITFAADLNKSEALYAKDFDFLARNSTTFTNPFAVRNPDYVLGVRPTTVLGPILAANADGLPPGVFVNSFRSHTALPGGTIFRANPARTLQSGATMQVYESPTAGGTFNSNVSLGSLDAAAYYSGQFFPSQPNLCNAGAFSAAQAATAAAANPRICNFAPSALPTGVTAARVFATYGVTPPAGATTAELNRLALDTLQSRLPTAREYFQANPNLDPNLFIGSFIQGYPGIASGNPLLPIVAQPLRFDSNGNVVQFSVGDLNSNSPGSFGSAPGSSSDLFNAADRNIQRFEQERSIFNVNARFDITDNISFFTENLYSDIRSVNEINPQSSFNSVGSAGIENGGIIASVNNPFLTTQNRADLAARGITSTFALSTDFYDIFGGNNEARSKSETFRSVNGVRGDFFTHGRNFNWEVAYSYGGSDFRYETKFIKDVEFLLAIDAVNDGGTIRCRSQTALGAGVLGTSPPGLTNNVVRVPYAVNANPAVPVVGDVPQDQNYQPVVTQAQIDGCQPLNLFGVGRSSQAARDYILADTFITNEARQEYWSAVFGGELFKLPAGWLSFAVNAENRKESLVYGGDQLGQLGRSRSAPTALTDAEIKTEEYGVELNIPVFSPDQNLPFLYNLTINPAWRWVKQTGSAAAFRNANGTLVEPKYDGDYQDIYSIAATYSPVRDLTFRGNISRSVRQPGIVDLFLGSQPAFLSNGVDACGSTNIDSGPSPATRRANCETLVRQLNPVSNTYQSGVIDPTLTDAENTARIRNFLSTFSSSVPTFQTIVAGEPGLKPEVANSYTWGIVAQPRFIPGLSLSADYIKITVKGLISNLFATTANQFCVDSSTYPNTQPQTGLDLCPYVIRDNQFAITNGSISGFWNQGGIRVQALNLNAAYGFNVSELFGDGASDFGRMGLRASAYHLIKYQSSPDGAFGDNTTYTQGTTARPDWEVQLGANYSRGPVRLSWTGNWQDTTKVYAGNGTLFPTVDQATVRFYRSYWIHSATAAYDVTEAARVQLTVDNVFDTIYPSVQYEIAGSPQSLGRTIMGQLIYKF